MKITVLTYLDSEDENSKEYDPVVPQVARTLRRLGHRVSVLGVHGDVKRLIAGLSRRKPELVFNLMEMFGDNVFGDIPVTGLLELLGLRYTGSGPGACPVADTSAASAPVPCRSSPTAETRDRGLLRWENHLQQPHDRAHRASSGRSARQRRKRQAGGLLAPFGNC